MKRILVLLGLVTSFAFVGCKDCHECHYEDINGLEVDLGEYCDDELILIEETGIIVADTTFEVHCHEH